MHICCNAFSRDCGSKRTTRRQRYVQLNLFTVSDLVHVSAVHTQVYKSKYRKTAAEFVVRSVQGRYTGRQSMMGHGIQTGKRQRRNRLNKQRSATGDLSNTGNRWNARNMERLRRTGNERQGPTNYIHQVMRDR